MQIFIQEDADVSTAILQPSMLADEGCSIAVKISAPF